MKFWNYLKKQEDSPEYREAKQRIMKLHDPEKNMAYIEWMSRLEKETGEMQVEFVHGSLKTGEEICFYDCCGKESGRAVIAELYVRKNEDFSETSESGEKGRIVFKEKEEESGEFWRSQYVCEEKNKKIEKKC